MCSKVQDVAHCASPHSNQQSPAQADRNVQRTRSLGSYLGGKKNQILEPKSPLLSRQRSVCSVRPQCRGSNCPAHLFTLLLFTLLGE